MNPKRHRATIYCLPLLWMSQVCPQAIDFEFAVEKASWGSQQKGYEYSLVGIFGVDPFPWPSDLAVAMRKYSQRNSVSLTDQLRDAIAGAIMAALQVEESEIQYLRTVIKRSTSPLTQENKRRRAEL